MNTNQTKKSIYAIIAGLGMATILSGCNSDSILSEAVFSRVASDTLAKHASANGKLVANGVKLVRNTGSVTRGLAHVSVKANSNDSVTVNALGKTATFTKADEMDEGGIFYENNQGWVDFNGNSAEDIASGNSSYTYMTPVKGGMAEEDGPWDRYYAVVGLETPHDVIASKANATYSGRFSVDEYPTDNHLNEAREKQFGDVNLQANFTGAKINGTLTFDPEPSLSRANAPGDVVTLKEANITGNSFATTFEADEVEDGGVTGTLEGDFQGRFYGNTAQEAGGTIAWDYQGVEGGQVENSVAAGTWTAREDSAVTAGSIVD